MSLFGSDAKDEKISVIARFRAKSGHEEEVGKALASLVEPSQKEPGCLKYGVYADKYYTGSYFTYEEWTSEAALDVHLAAHRSALDKSKALLREELTISVLRALE